MPIVRLVALLMLSVATTAAEPRAFLEKHCFECHDQETKKGGLDLTTLGAEKSNPAKWTQIHDAVAAGEMPPAKRKERPSADEASAFLQELDATLTKLSTEARPTRIQLRRLTRVEFENTLQDLLALPRLDIQGLLPSDGRVAGYDKMSAGLDLSPGHLAAYAEAVEKALDLAIATQSTPPRVYQKRVYPAGLFKFGGNLAHGQFVLLKDKQPDPALPVRGGHEDKQGHVGFEGPDLKERGALVRSDAVAKSQSAVGLLNPNLAGYEAAMNVAPIYAGMYRLRLSVWGFHWANGRPNPCDAPQAAVLRAHEEGKQQEGGRLLSAFTAPSMESKVGEITTWLDAHESIVFDPVSVPWNGLRIGQVAGRAAKHVGPGVALDWFEIEGPLHPVWPPVSHSRLFGSLPIKPWAGGEALPPRREKIRSQGGYLPSMYFDLTPAEREPKLETVQSADPTEDARRLLADFLPRAFRRDVAEAEFEPYLELLRRRLAAKDCFEDAMRRVYVAALTSPEFLFLAGDAAPTPAEFTLASRLSYWLWNSPPDAPLLAAARDGSLRRPEILRAQIDRLLADPRAERFVSDFTRQWLDLSRLDETNPDPLLYPEYRFLLGEGVAGEPAALFAELLKHDLPARSLLQPDFAMLTQRLAEHYGISGVMGVERRKVVLPPGHLRGGLLGQAAIHKLTANGTTTSPVKRGVWVSDRLLDDPAPPPPPGISAVDPDTRGTTTVREQLAKHRSDPNCAACHAKIDPPGFALEAFDPIGGLRSRYRSNGKGDTPAEKGQVPWRVEYKLGPPVDASGELRDGRTFNGPGELAARLAADDARLARAFVAHLTRYATGAEVSYADRAEIRRIVEQTRGECYRLRALIHGLARSRLFLPPQR
jgi:mono/diheme cytochrome c family protein